MTAQGIYELGPVIIDCLKAPECRLRSQLGCLGYGNSTVYPNKRGHKSKSQAGLDVDSKSGTFYCHIIIRD